MSLSIKQFAQELNRDIKEVTEACKKFGITKTVLEKSEQNTIKQYLQEKKGMK